jgi:signal transduction histidine kinase
MFESLLNNLLSLPFWATLVLAAVFIYWFYKDHKTWKLIFAIATILAALAYSDLATQRFGGTLLLGPAYMWAFLPVTTAVPVITISSLRNIKNLNNPFKIIVATIVISIAIMISQIDIRSVIITLLWSMVAVSIPAMMHIVVKRKNHSDLMFLLALIFLSSEGVAQVIFRETEASVILGAVGILFAGLTFAVPKNCYMDGVITQLTLKEELDQTKEELRIVQERLLKAERLATIGDLAAMIGHDLRNPLQGIAGAAYYLRTRTNTPTDQTTGEMIDTIEKCVDYSNKIVNDLLEYSKEIHIELKETTPKNLIEQSLNQIIIPSTIQIKNQSENKPTLNIDEQKIERVFKNIIQNAFDAMPNGGTLAIKTQTNNKEAIFDFTDTGIGMSQETLSKLWIPLFTTKAKGMGFGLSICKRIIEAHGGTISVESTIGKGSSLKVTLPLKGKITNNEQSRYLSTPELTKIIDTMIKESKGKNT